MTPFPSLPYKHGTSERWCPSVLPPSWSTSPLSSSDPLCFPILAECPAIQFISDMNYPALPQTAHIKKGSVLQDCSYFRHQLEVLGGPLELLSNSAANSGILTIPSSCLIIHWNNSQNPGKYCTYNYQFSIKDSNSQMNGVYRVKSGGVQSAGASVPVELGYATQLVREFTIQEPPLNLRVQSFLKSRFHYTSMIDYIIGYW